MTLAAATDAESTRSQQPKPDIFYPSEDGEPLAETSMHADAIITTVAVLRNYLAAFPDKSPVVLVDQFLYYAQGFPRLRVAPDVMVIFEIPQIPYDNYKIWETGKVPSIIFEITSAGTQTQDRDHKKTLYESIGVWEYWLFDPKGEWIAEHLLGYRLQQTDPDLEPVYVTIADKSSQILGLQLEVEDGSIGFYRQDTGERLLIPSELSEALQVQTQRAEAAEQENQRLRDRLLALGIDPDAV
ncbi:MAG: Uma2 family endonuclease [Pseudanabaena sp. RU_4_16]|nr:Uma2 family endonuclease [Pseudanabaena sp. RU_4_16]